MSSSSHVNAPRSVSRRVFTLQDQRWFAQCSGDFNPVHLDPVIARRELPGDVVVHGVHLVLWALEAFFEQTPANDAVGMRLVRLKCNFRAPVYLDVPVEVLVAGEDAEKIKLSIVQHGQTACACSVTVEPLRAGARPVMAPQRREPWPEQVDDVAFADLPGKRGSTPVQMAPDALRPPFQALADRLGTAWVAELMAITRVVGMNCPGWHSMLSGLDLAGRPETSAAENLQYAVEEADARMGLVVLRVEGMVSRGTVNSFHRPGVVAQMQYNDVKALVRPDEFKGQHALVIGGSRGIGEATAKLIAAGGGEVWLTYHVGEEDARAVCRDITAGGGRCRFSAFSVGSATKGLEALEQAGFAPTHVYFSATPRLVRTRPSSFNASLHATYEGVYVAGFSDLYEACTARWGTSLLYLYPSSIAVEEQTPDMSEYRAAKEAGESLCASLNARSASPQVLVVRLPMVVTELSRGLLDSDSADAMSTMLPIIRKMASGVLR